MYRSGMGAHRSLGCLVGGSYCGEWEDGRLGMCSNLNFFGHLVYMPIFIDDYPYNGMNYQGDPDLPIPPGQAWGPDSKC